MACDDCVSSTSSATKCSSCWRAAPTICVARLAHWQHYARSPPALEKEGIKWTEYCSLQRAIVKKARHGPQNFRSPLCAKPSLWESVARIARCETGEGLRSFDREPLTRLAAAPRRRSTPSHKGRGKRARIC